MDVAFVILADCANQTLDGKLNLLGAFSQVNAATFPAALLSRMVIVRFVFGAIEDGEEHEIEVRLVGPDNEILGRKPGHVRLGGGKGARSFFDVADYVSPLVFPKPGNYEVRVLIDGVESPVVAPITAYLIPKPEVTDE